MPLTSKLLRAGAGTRFRVMTGIAFMGSFVDRQPQQKNWPGGMHSWIWVPVLVSLQPTWCQNSCQQLWPARAASNSSSHPLQLRSRWTTAPTLSWLCLPLGSENSQSPTLLPTLIVHHKMPRKPGRSRLPVCDACYARQMHLTAPSTGGS